MITKDQPKIFKGFPIKTLVGDINDGDTAYGRQPDEQVQDNINKLIECNKLAFIRCLYDREDFSRIQRLDEGSSLPHSAQKDNSIEVDAVTTNTPGITLALPVADCIATIIYDPVNNAIALAHFGRHASMDKLHLELIKHMTAEYSSNPKDLLIFMSPSIKSSHYIMEWFDKKNDPDWISYCQEKSEGVHLDLPGFNKSQFMKHGVLDKNIEISPINTATDPNYGSHYAHHSIDPDYKQDRFLATATLT